jgi:ADP-ribose pyrophosphatase YjhB (NUDIX family)
MKLIFCPECGAKLVQKDATTYVCANGHPFWNNPRAATAVALVKNGQVLFSKRALPPAKGKYDLPGGFTDYDETIFECARRELREEAGIELGELHLLYAVRNQYDENVSTCDAILVCRDWKGTPKPSDHEVASLEWKPIDFLDSDEFAWDYAGVSDKLKHYLNHAQTS